MVIDYLGTNPSSPGINLQPLFTTKRSHEPANHDVTRTSITRTPKNAWLIIPAENERLRMENAYLKKLNTLVQMKEKLQPKSKRK